MHSRNRLISKKMAVNPSQDCFAKSAEDGAANGKTQMGTTKIVTKGGELQDENLRASA